MTSIYGMGCLKMDSNIKLVYEDFLKRKAKLVIHKVQQIAYNRFDGSRVEIDVGPFDCDYIYLRYGCFGAANEG